MGGSLVMRGAAFCHHRRRKDRAGATVNGLPAQKGWSGTVAATLALVALMDSLVPAYRASRLDPVKVLRAD
jgi:ABC-type lipoprotein release transport system permease subunit